MRGTNELHGLPRGPVRRLAALAERARDQAGATTDDAIRRVYVELAASLTRDVSAIAAGRRMALR